MNETLVSIEIQLNTSALECYLMCFTGVCLRKGGRRGGGRRSHGSGSRGGKGGKGGLPSKGNMPSVQEGQEMDMPTYTRGGRGDWGGHAPSKG